MVAFNPKKDMAAHPLKGSGEKNSKILLRSNLNLLVDSFFQVYSKSLATSLYDNNKFITGLVLVIKQLQLISLFFLPQFDHLLRFNHHAADLVRVIGLLNPSLFILNLSTDDKIMVKFVTASVLLALLSCYLLKTMVFRTSQRGKFEDKQAGLFTLLINFCLTDFLAIPLLSLFLTPSCSGVARPSTASSRNPQVDISACVDLDVSIAELDFIQIAGVLVFIPLIVVLKRMNFEYRIKDVAFGSRRSNKTDSNSFLIIATSLLGFYFTYKIPTISYGLLFLGMISTHIIKYYSTDYICVGYRRMELLVSSLSIWFTLIITTLTILGEPVEMALTFFCVSTMFLLLALALKPNISGFYREGQKSVNKFKSPKETVCWLESILWLQHQSEIQMGGSMDTLFKGFFETYINSKSLKGVNNYSVLGSTTTGGFQDEEEAKLVFKTTSIRGMERKNKSSSQSRKMADFMTRSYLEALKRFPTNTSLRISFLVYLIDYTPYMTLALENLLLISSAKNLKIEQRLMIHRLRNIIDEAQMLQSKSKANNGGENPKTTAQESQYHTNQASTSFMSSLLIIKLHSHLNELFETATNHYMILWQILLDESLSISRFDQQVETCYWHFEEIEKVWNKNRILDAFNTGSKLNYGMFISQVLQREEEGSKIIEDFYFRMKFRNRSKNLLINFSNEDDVNGLSDPVMIIKTNETGRLMVHDCNLQFCQKLCYPKSQLAGQELLKIVHRSSIKFYYKLLIAGFEQATKLELRNSELEMKKRTRLYKLITLKKASGGIELFSAEIRSCKVDELDSFLLVKLIPNLEGRPEARILVDKHLCVVGNNNQTMGVFKLQNICLKSLGYKSMLDLLPGLKDVAKKYRSRQLADLISFKDITFMSPVIRQRRKARDNKNGWKYSQRRKFNVRVIRVDDSSHFVLKIWKVLEDNANASVQYLATMKTGLSGLLTVATPRETRGSVMSNSTLIHLEPEEECLFRQKKRLLVEYLRRRLSINYSGPDGDSAEIDYGKGIQTRRLVDGYLRDIYDDEEDDESMMMSRNSDPTKPRPKSIFDHSDSFANEANSLLRLTSQNDLDNLLTKQKKVIPPVKFLATFSIVFFVSLFVVITYFVYDDHLQIMGLSQLINLKKYSVLTNVVLQQILSRIYDICIINSGVNLLLGTSYPDKTDQFVLESVEYLDMWTETLRTAHSRFENIELLQPYFQIIKDERIKPIVTLRYEKSFKNYTFRHAIHQVVSVLYNLDTKDKTKITFEDKDVDFVLYNINNGIAQNNIRIMLKTVGIRKLLVQNTANQLDNRMIILSVPLALMLLVSCSSIFLTLNKRKHALESFYGFDDDYLKLILRKNERFVEYIQNEEADLDKEMIGGFEESVGSGDQFLDASASEVDLENEEDQKKAFGRKLTNNMHGSKKNIEKNSLKKKRKKKGQYRRLRKRKIKGSLVGFLSFWQLLILCFVGSNIYGLYTIYKQKSAMISRGFEGSSFIFNLINKFSLISGMRNNFVTAMLDPENTARGTPVLNVAKFYDRIVLFYIDEIYKASLAYGADTNPYQEVVNAVFKDDVCEVYEKYKKNSTNEVLVDCDSFHGGIMKQGMQVAMSQMSERMRDFLTRIIYLTEEKPSVYPFEGPCPEFPSRPPQLRFLTCLLVSKESNDIWIFIKNFIEPINRGLADYIENKVNEELRIHRAFNFGYFVIHMIYLLMGTVVLNLLASAYNDRIFRINSMMRFHGCERMKTNHRMMEYLRSWSTI